MLKFMVNCNSSVDFAATYDIAEYLSVPDKKISLPGFGQSYTLFNGAKHESTKTIIPEAT
jgi:hypothetical protein